MTCSSRCISLLLQLIERDSADGHSGTPVPTGSPHKCSETSSKLPDRLLTHLATLLPESLVHEALRILDHATIVVFKPPDLSTPTQIPPPLSLAVLIPPDPNQVGAGGNACSTLPQPIGVGDGDGVGYRDIVDWMQQAMQPVLGFRNQQLQEIQQQQQSRRGFNSRRSSGASVAGTAMRLPQIWGQLPAVCLLDGNHCSCPAFRSLVVEQGESLVCPHILAAVLAYHSDPTISLPISASASADIAFHWMCGTGVFDSSVFPKPSS
ncbi:hypothetical protein BCR44DRAFT_59520 [Catenaria anguillulae PL171]|uniref:SWIM-type domain-containing protein n=1 Tax=Catenaria anguillulae PL171 TaxID=765915 RepID=A0A1Y2H9S9_9FUNG|nr:hypothetical protein BCR44DRAFT_59520 [Catenaria anguillulae PL171]